MAKILLTIFLGGVFTLMTNAGNLIKNSDFESWTSGVPDQWSGSGIERSSIFVENGQAVVISASKAVKGRLQSAEFSLSPETDYILSFFYQAPGGAGLSGQIPHVKHFSLSVPYVHRAGIKLDIPFRTGKEVPASSYLKFVAGGDGIVAIDGVTLTQAKSAWNKAVFERHDNNKAYCKFTVGNPGDASVNYDVDMVIYDYFNQVLWQETAKIELPAGEEKSWRQLVATGDSRRYRAVLKISGSNDFSDEIWSYYNCDVTKGIRKRYLLSDKIWDHQQTTLKTPPSQYKWQKVSIPHFAKASKKKEPYYSYYRLNVKTPVVSRNNELFLNLINCPLSPEVFINGKIAGSIAGRSPLNLNITDLWKNGKENEILVRCQSREAGHYKKDNGGVKHLLPYSANNSGLTDDVTLEIRPKTRTDLLKIETSVKNKELTVKGQVRNDTLQPGWFTVESTVYDNGKPVLNTTAKKFYLTPFEPVVFKINEKWAQPHLYFPHDPHLYKLETIVKDHAGKILDRKSSRFGFREIETVGKDVLYNGKKAKFISRLSAPHPAHVYRDMKVPVDVLMNRNFRALQQYVRLGLVYGREYPLMGRLPVWRLDIMDEMGFVTRSSFELNMAYTGMNDSYENSPEYWDGMRRFIENSLRTLWNHPSIIEWDMENETFLCSTQHTYPELYDEFHRLRQIVRGTDKTRPLLHDSADPMGDGDIISLHYPIEVTRQFPPSPSFPLIPFEKGKLYSQLNLHPGAYVWNEDRPLMLGEDLIDVREFPQSLSLYFNEDVYGYVRKGQSFGISYYLNNMAKMNEMLQYLGREYRKREVHLLTSWACCVEAHSDELTRDAIVVDQYHQNFFSGESVKRSFSFFHDPMIDFEAQITWMIKDKSGSIVDKGNITKAISGGDYVQHQFTVNIPSVNTETPYTLELTVADAKTEKEICSRSQEWRVFPNTKIEVPESLKIGLFDPNGETDSALKKAGVEFSRLETLSPTKIDLLIIGKNALPKERNQVEASNLDSFVQKGGKVLVLAQDSRVADWFPYSPTKNNGIYWPVNLIRIPEHPIAAGLIDDDLKFWRGKDQMVSAANWYKPWRGNALSIFDGGSMGGYLTSSLLEIPSGKGCYLLSQLKLTDKLFVEPAVGKVVNNIFKYATQPLYSSCNGSLAYIGGHGLRQAVESCGAELTDLSLGDNTTASSILVDAEHKLSIKEIEKLKQLATSGTKIWLQGLSKSNATHWAALIGSCKFESYSSASVIKSKNSAHIPGLSNTDLFWIGVPEWDFYGKSFDQVDVGRIVDNPPLPLKDAEQIIVHGALQWLTIGKGGILIDAMNWPENLNSLSQRAPRIPCSIMTGLGVKLQPVLNEKRTSDASSFTSIDLSRKFNLPLNGTLPTGSATFAGIPFKMKGKGKGAIMLGSNRLTKPTRWLKNEVTGININKKANSLFLLLSCFNPYESGRGFGTGEIIGGVTLEFDDGTSHVFPIQQKVDCANLFETYGDLKRGRVGWEGVNPFDLILSKLTIWPDDEWIQTSGLNRLYVTQFKNPFPQKKILSISLKSSNQHFVPIVFGATLK